MVGRKYVRLWRRKLHRYPAATHKQVMLICQLWRDKYSPTIASMLSVREASELIDVLLPLNKALRNWHWRGWTKVEELQQKRDAVQQKIESAVYNNNKEEQWK